MTRHSGSLCKMPNNRRKVAFSGKKKKEQMIARKARRQHGRADEDGNGHYYAEDPMGAEGQDVAINYQEEIMAVNQQPGVNARVNRYNLKFRRETAAEKEKRRALHSQPVDMLPQTNLETRSEEFYPPGLSYPIRPAWRANMSKPELDASENKYFRLFCDKIDREFSRENLSMYELNLETWRQLWRVTEMSDILLIIVDARFPVAQFPPYLYEHLVKKEGKEIILILNKCDLLPPSVVLAWEQYFTETFPKLLVVPFSSLEGKKTHRTLLKMAAKSSLCLVDACQQLVDDTVNLTSWRKKIEEECELEIDDDSLVEVLETKLIAAQSTVPEAYQRFKDGILTIGALGHPNVGKSSLINALMGKKVVSVSKTPGHTKHFQTIFLTKNIKLCDCPGLVFPSTVEMPLQVLLGSFPVAQVRDPISVVHFVACRLDIPSILKLRLTEEDLQYSGLTSYLICQAWADRRGYRTKSRGVPDVSRAANEILRLCLNGHKSLVVYHRPPGYYGNKEKFESDPQIQRIRSIQGFHAQQIEENNGSERYHKEVVEEIVDSMSEEEEVMEELDGEEEEEEEEDDGESEDGYPVTAVQNKFALLPDED